MLLSHTKDVKFGTGRGTLGEKYPGERIKASVISEIDPAKCAGYANVVLVCGTNDLRPEYNPDIQALSQSLIEKVKQLRAINPFGKVVIMPVLPTRDQVMNKNVMAFNRLIGEWVTKVRSRDMYLSHPFVSDFLDSQGLLAEKWTRGGDSIHLGTVGLSKFISIIKNSIYLREKLIRDITAKQKTANQSRPGFRKPG